MKPKFKQISNQSLTEEMFIKAIEAFNIGIMRINFRNCNFKCDVIKILDDKFGVKVLEQEVLIDFRGNNENLGSFSNVFIEAMKANRLKIKF